MHALKVTHWLPLSVTDLGSERIVVVSEVLFVSSAYSIHLHPPKI